MNPRYVLVGPRAGHRCEYCRAPEGMFNSPHEVDHIVPAGKGGQDEAENWALACRWCNLHKRDHDNGIDPVKGNAVPLFNPRRQRWDEHFRASTETWSVEGLTPIGRATVERLQMNASPQRPARQQWARLEEWP